MLPPDPRLLPHHPRACSLLPPAATPSSPGGRALFPIDGRAHFPHQRPRRLPQWRPRSLPPPAVALHSPARTRSASTRALLAMGTSTPPCPGNRRRCLPRTTKQLRRNNTTVHLLLEGSTLV